MVHNDQLRIPAVYMRGGSSKAMFLKQEDIPEPGPLRDQVLKRMMGTPDPIQVDGMGGAKAVTSKMAIIAKSDRENVDIDYTFAQVGVRDDMIDYKLNCGNISAAVGPFAIEEGLVQTFRPGLPLQQGTIKTQEVRIFNTGTEKVLISHVPVNEDGNVVTQGTCEIAGVPGAAAPVLLDYRETIGAGLNKGILPTGNPLDHVKIGDRNVPFTLCDVANVYIFAKASDLGISGHETASTLTSDLKLLSRVRELRGKAAELVGMCQDWTKVDQQSPFIPMVILVAAPPSSADGDISGRLFLDNMCHESMAGTGSMAFGACSRTEGTIVYQQLEDAAFSKNDLRISHPLGTMRISVETESPGPSVHPTFKTLSFIRTARRIMDGHVYIPKPITQVNGEPKQRKRSVESEQDIPVTEIFADFIAKTQPDILSDDIVSRLKEYVLDYFGVSIAAAGICESTVPFLNGIKSLGANSGSCTVLLAGQTWAPQYAGLLNAALGHSLDFDDTYAQGSLHAGVTAISAGLTQAEMMSNSNEQVDNRQLMLAIAVGYEIICRLGRELGPDAYARGFHNTSTAGIFGAVATISALRRLDTSTIRNAFGLALSKAAGSMQYLENGSWNKRLHPGFAVHDAFICVSLAQAGVIGAAKSIEGKHGLLHAYSPRSPDSAYLTRDLGSRWEFLETALKPYPACRMTHGLIEVAGKLGESNRNRQVKKMTISLSPSNFKVVGARTSNKLHPDNIVDAQFSAYFQLAHSWLYGSDTGLQGFQRCGDRKIFDLSEKTSCVEDATVTAMGSKLQILYADQTTEQFDIPKPLGEPGRPFTKDKIETKYFSLTTPIIGRDKATKLKSLVNDMSGTFIKDVFKLLQ